MKAKREPPKSPPAPAPVPVAVPAPALPRRSHFMRPIVAFMVFSSIFFWYLIYFQMSDPNAHRLIAGESEEARKLAAHLRGMVLWGGTAIALTCALLWNIYLAAWETIGHRLIREEWRQRAGWGLLLAFFAFAGYVMFADAASFYDVGGRASNVLLAEIDSARSGSKPPSMAIAVNNCLAVLAIISIVGALAVLARASSLETLQSVADAIRRYEWLLYSASMLLVIGLCEIYALYVWGGGIASVTPVPAGNDAVAMLTRLATEKKAPGSAMALANNAAIGAGFIFSTLLALLFVPVAAAHSDALREKFNEEENAPGAASFDYTARIRQLGLGSANTFGSLAHVTAIFAPLAVGLATKLLEIGPK